MSIIVKVTVEPKPIIVKAAARGATGAPGSAGLVLATITGVDGTAVAATNLWLATGDAAVLGYVVRLTGVTGFTSVPKVSIRTTVPGIILPTTTLLGLDVLNEAKSNLTGGLVPLVLNGQQVTFSVDTAAVATVYTIAVDLIGYLI